MIAENMKKEMKRIIIIAAIATFSIGPVMGQMVLDSIVGVVGEYKILQSDIETQYLQNKGFKSPWPFDQFPEK